VPDCSVIVCTRYREALLGRCLESLAKLDYPSYEVLVVDNTPGDPATRRLTSDTGTRYVRDARTGLSRARNTGASAANGELLAFIDDDAIAEPGWLAAHAAVLADPSLAASTGRVLPISKPANGEGDSRMLDLGETPFRIDRDTSSWFEIANFGGLGFGGNMVFRRELFEAGFHFRESLGAGSLLGWGEEAYAFFTLIRRGHRIAYVPEAVVRHGDPETTAGSAAKRTAERRFSAAYVFMLFVEEPGFRRRTGRYIAQAFRRQQPPWRRYRPQTPALRRRMLRAAFSGPLLYLSNRLRSPTRPTTAKAESIRHRVKYRLAVTAGRLSRPLAGPLNWMLRLAKRRAGVALLYHTIDVRQGDRERELVPPIDRSRFRRQLEYLARHYNVVPADRFLSTVANRRRGERFPVCLSFDDDVPEHLSHAVPELRRLGLPASFFLCGAALDGEPGSFWWQRLQRAGDRGIPLGEIAGLLPAGSELVLRGAPRDIHRISDAVIELEPERRDEFSAALLELTGPDPQNDLISAAEIAALARNGFQIGFHTRRHDRLTHLDDERLARALQENRRALEKIAGRPIESIAYPYGFADDRVASAARQAGFKLGFTSERIATTPSSDPLLLGRLELLTDSVGEFGARLQYALLRATERR